MGEEGNKEKKAGKYCRGVRRMTPVLAAGCILLAGCSADNPSAAVSDNPYGDGSDGSWESAMTEQESGGAGQDGGQKDSSGDDSTGKDGNSQGNGQGGGSGDDSAGKDGDGQGNGQEGGSGKGSTDQERSSGQNAENEEELSVEENIELTASYKGLDHANPLMTQTFGADPYAMVYGDRVYIYMTGDTFEYDGDGNVTENTYGKIHEIRVISTNDMVNFTDHGAVNAASGQGAAKWAHNSWAPAATWKEIDGKPQFFLYFADAAGGIGVLQSDSPAGPFKDPLGKALITRQTPNCEDVAWLFDPAVLMDEDGRAYLYFGGGVPEGKEADPGTARAVELGEDMISILGEPVRLDVPYLFEDSGIHKAGGKYYYTYCSNWQVDEAGTLKYGFRNAEIVSMEGESPLGPFTVKETILQNPGSVFGLYGNNHHCVFQFQGNWYIAYHTRVLEKNMGVEKGYRCTHIDSFDMQADGTIGTIKQTLKGREQLRYVDPYEENRAANFAVMGGVECVPTDSVSKYYGCGNMALGGIDTGDFVKVQGVDFGEGGASRMMVTVKNPSGSEGVIQLRLDGPEGEVAARLPVEPSESDEFEEIRADVKAVSGVHDLFFIFEGSGYELETWRFEK